MHESTRFNRINGYSSNALEPKTRFMTIQMTMTAIKLKINAQLPAKRATASAARCPNVMCSSLSAFFVTSVAISWWISSSSVNSSSVTCKSSLIIWLRFAPFFIVNLPLIPRFFAAFRRYLQSITKPRALSTARCKNSEKTHICGFALRICVLKFNKL